MVAADSGAAILNDSFEPLCVVATASVLVEPPYREASFYLAEPIFAEVEKGPILVIHELDLCQKILREVKADVVHLDISLGGLNLEELSPIQLSEMKISSKAKKEILGVLPKIRKAASSLKQAYGIDVLAIGKESIPVRIAELTSGAHAVLYASEKAITDKAKVKLGLPMNCQPMVSRDTITLQSLTPTEHDVKGYAKDEKKVLKKVRFSEMLNPCIRSFRIVEIIPKKT